MNLPVVDIWRNIYLHSMLFMLLPIVVWLMSLFRHVSKQKTLRASLICLGDLIYVFFAIGDLIYTPTATPRSS